MVAGSTTLAAGATNNITSNNAGNNFSTVGITNGNNVTLVDVNGLDLGTSTVSGTLGVTTGALTTERRPQRDRDHDYSCGFGQRHHTDECGKQFQYGRGYECAQCRVNGRQHT